MCDDLAPEHYSGYQVRRRQAERGGAGAWRARARPHLCAAPRIAFWEVCPSRPLLASPAASERTAPLPTSTYGPLAPG